MPENLEGEVEPVPDKLGEGGDGEPPQESVLV